ncbi:Serine/threonine-protein phosphatase 6 regulatory ankyrin repeat subunit C, partial [Cladorrhinum sp. PSN332]
THTWDDSPTLASNMRMSMAPDPFARMGWKPKTRIPRQQSCRELVKPNRTLPQPTPSVWVHGSRCRCGQEKQERESADDGLTQAIETISAAYRARRKLELEAISRRDSESRPASIRPPHRRSRSAGLTSTITRLFKKPSRPAPVALTIQEIADLCNASADLDIQKVAQYLFSAGPHGFSSIVNTSNHLGTTPLMACLRASSARVYPKAHLAMLTFLLDCGANPNATTSGPSQGHAPGIGLGTASVLSAACALDLPGGHGGRIVKLLLDRGAAVDVALPFSPSSSPTVASSRKARKQQSLLQTQQKGKGGGQTAIHIATLAGNYEALEVLLSHGGADVNRAFDASSSTDNNNNSTNWEPTSSTSSSARSSTEVGGRRRMKNPVTALHLAHGSPACAKVLLTHGADFRLRDGYGRTPLHWAAEFGSVQVVGMLLDAGAEADAGAGAGAGGPEDDVMTAAATPLGGVVAVLESGVGRPGHVAVARLLIGRGAETEENDNNGLRERLLAVEEWREVFEDI